METTLIRINTRQLRLGMYVHEFCGSWMEHPFLRGAFLLDKSDDLQTILASSIREVWIDQALGLSINSGASEETVAQEVEATLTQADQAEKLVQRVDVAQEAKRTVKICARSKQAISSMFKEARMGKAMNADDALPIVEEISNSVMRNPGALIGLARLKNKDDYTYMHSIAVCALMSSLARQLGLSDEQVLEAGLAGMLHDVGKMMIPLDILNKPGKLTDTEFQIVKNHPSMGHKMLLEGKGISQAVLDACLHHHERRMAAVTPDGSPIRISACTQK